MAVAKWEGFLPRAYLDTIASPPVWTIFFGHTSAAGPPVVHSGDSGTEAEGKRVLADDLRDAAATVAEKVHVRLSVRQRIALISIVFNCGPGVLDDTKIVNALNAKEYREAADHFLEWSHAGGVVVQGLLNRRRAERWMMMHPLLPKRHRAVPTFGKAEKARSHPS
jgi:lysozyme